MSRRKENPQPFSELSEEDKLALLREVLETTPDRFTYQIEFIKGEFFNLKIQVDNSDFSFDNRVSAYRATRILDESSTLNIVPPEE